jgi:hypothetical protein
MEDSRDEFMSSDDSFLVVVWRCVAAVLVTLIVSVASCTAYQSHTVLEMVKGGADPVKAGCVYAVGSNAMCLTQIGK